MTTFALFTQKSPSATYQMLPAPRRAGLVVFIISFQVKTSVQRNQMRLPSPSLKRGRRATPALLGQRSYGRRRQGRSEGAGPKSVGNPSPF